MVVSEEAHERVVALVMRGDVSGATDLLLTQALPAHDHFEMSVNRLIDSRREAMVVAIAQASADMRHALMLVAIAGLLVLIFGAVVAVRVVRQIVKSEDALHREKELAEVTLHSIADGVITLDAERQYRLHESGGGRIYRLEKPGSQRPARSMRYTGWSTSRPASRFRIRAAMRQARAGRRA